MPNQTTTPAQHPTGFEASRRPQNHVTDCLPRLDWSLPPARRFPFQKHPPQTLPPPTPMPVWTRPRIFTLFCTCGCFFWFGNAVECCVIAPFRFGQRHPAWSGVTARRESPVCESATLRCSFHSRICMFSKLRTPSEKTGNLLCSFPQPLKTSTTTHSLADKPYQLTPPRHSPNNVPPLAAQRGGDSGGERAARERWGHRTH